MASATISKYMTWVRAAVKDNARLRKEHKAFLQTQDELVSEVQRLNREIKLQVALRDAAEAGCGLVMNHLRGSAMPTYRVEVEIVSGDAIGVISDYSKTPEFSELSMRLILEWLEKAGMDHLKNAWNTLQSGACGDNRPPKDPAVIHLSKAEIQSGLDRVKWAEALIRQLPDNHDGRNSWLLNYGRKSTNQEAK